jgi:DHA2 family multidrug resistance protein-like MFS transporter
MVGSAIGPLLGGFMLEHFWWGSVFLLGVPVMVVLLILGPLLLPENRDPNAGRLDILSAALSLVAILAVIYGIKRMATDGFSREAALAIAAGVVIGTVFVLRQRKLRDPIMDLELFRVAAFRTSVGTQLVALVAMAGAYFFTVQYLQLVVGLGPLPAGLWLIPSTIAGMGGSMFAPVLARRYRPAFVMGGGLGMGAVGFAMLLLVGGGWGLAVLIPAFVIMSIGISATMTVTTDLIVGVAPPERAGAASAISETSSELGLALGIAVIGSIGTAVYRRDMVNAIPPGVPTEAADAARDTLGSALAVAARLPGEIGSDLADLARAAFTNALHSTAIVAAVLLTVLAAVVIMTLKQVPPRSSNV